MAKNPAPQTTDKTTASKSKDNHSRLTARANTKQAQLIELLKRKKGATIDDAVKATGWQPHSVRGAISGVIKKKLGLTVASEVMGNRGRVYRIIEQG